MRDRCMWCMLFPCGEHFSVFRCSLVYKAFLSKLARCSKQPNYRVKPGLSLPRAQHPALVSDPRERLLSSLPMSFTPLALPGLRFFLPTATERQLRKPPPPCRPGTWDASENCFLGSGNGEYDTAWHLITAALVLCWWRPRLVSLNNGRY